MKTRIKTALMLAAAMMVVAAACIRNDIPYPRVQCNFLTMEAEGQDRGAVIDTVTLTVNLHFPEEVDIENVVISEYTVTPGAEVLGDVLAEPINLRNPVNVTLRLYQDYQWLIKGSQEIERYFRFSGQVGSTFIDAPGRRVVGYISENTDLSAVKVEAIKLGPTGCTMSPDLNGRTVDFRQPVEVSVTAYGRTDLWTIYLQKTTVSVSTLSVDAWTCVAWAYGQAQAGKDNGFDYRLKGDTEWLRVPKDWVNEDGGSFSARLVHLSPLATYEVRAYSGEEYGQTLEFTTGEAKQVPNSNFDEWWLDGKVWCPWPEGGLQVWATGNKGAATLGQSNSVPTEETVSGSGWAAKLETRFVGIGALGKLAGGNIFVGKFVRTEGTNGVVNFGWGFQERPTKLKGYFKYTPAPINYASNGYESFKGRPDTCNIFCALIDTPEPYEIRTNPNNRQVFDPNGSYVIAYAGLEYGEAVSEYTPFELELNYRSTSRIPTYIVIVATASKYADYFTGGAGSTLFVDDFELVYDY